MKYSLLPLLAAFTCAVSAQTMMPAQREALNAAERWLVPVDAQRYGDAWMMAAETFKAKVPRDTFRDGIAKIRKDYGKVENRTGERMAFRGEVPAPDQPDAQSKPGAEVSILFETTFAGNRKAQEEMTMVLEKDGVWRVAGYYIK
ncbi:MAG: DUF4019 domain-containing protein [Burkholderiales bacterium]